MRNSLLDKRIPTLIGLVLLVLTIGATTLLTQYGRGLLTRAGPSEVPRNVKITNVTSSSFTVSWSTEEKVPGSLKVGENETTLDKAVLDERDLLSETTGLFSVHSTTVANLEPNKTYYFKMLSGANLYDNNGVPYSVSTAKQLPEGARKDRRLSGTALLEDGTAAKGLIVFLTIDGAQPLSTLVKDSGEYLIPLTSLRTLDLGTYYTPLDEDRIQLTLTDDKTTTKIQTLFKNSEKIPPVVLGRQYDFTLENPQLTPIASPSSSFTLPREGQPVASSKNPAITQPKTNEVFTDTTPVMKGTAPSGAKIQITIESDPIQVTVTADASGNWTFQTTTLSPGTHTLTVRIPDQNGIMQVLTRVFTVQPPGVQIAEAATPSATLAPTTTPTPTISATPTPTGAISTSITSTPSAKGGAPTVAPSIAPIPQSGAVFPSYVLAFVGIAFSLIGLSLLFLR